MAERIEVFGPDGNMSSFDSADEAHRFALREALYGGRIEITDEFGTRHIERIERTDDPSRLNIEFILEPFQPSEEEVFDIAVIQGDAVSTTMGVEAFFASPQVREVSKTDEVVLRFDRPSDGSPGWVLQAWHGNDLISMAPAPTFADAYLAMGDEIEDHIEEE